MFLSHFFQVGYEWLKVYISVLISDNGKVLYSTDDMRVSAKPEQIFEE